MTIAVIGSGIAGLSAAWLLNENHSVTVYEKNSWVGGHSNTVEVKLGAISVPVDTGFIVYNGRNYPNLVALFDHFNVPTKPSEMSFSASLDGGNFEYAGTDFNGLLGQRRNILRPRFWRMLRNILRFYREAPHLLNNPLNVDLSLAAYLKREGYDHSFIEDHLLPMGAAIWSTTAAEINAYPAHSFVQFFESHGLLSLTHRPKWRTVDGGSREYVSRLTKSFKNHIRPYGASAVSRSSDKVRVQDTTGNTSVFDQVIFACHADEALNILDDATDEETRLLGAWSYTKNRAILHSDPSLMPKRRRVWSSWNFLNNTNGPGPCVTYWMNRLQNLKTKTPLFVTLNPVSEPKADYIHQEFIYTHPHFNKAATQTQRALWGLQGQKRSWFCGSYFGYGFHEDALQSGLAVAEQLGNVRRPWTLKGESDRIHIIPKNNEVAL